MVDRAAPLLFLTLAAWLLPQTTGAQSPAGATAPSAERLIIGDGYLVKVRRGNAEERVVGDLAKANDRWLVLHCRSIGNEVGVPLAPNSKVFRNVGRAVTDENVWIPRDAALLERHVPRASKLPIVQLADEAPPRQAQCTVEAADGYQLARQEGQFLGWAGSDLALAQQPGQAPRRIAYAEILCLRFRQPR